MALAASSELLVGLKAKSKLQAKLSETQSELAKAG